MEIHWRAALQVKGFLKIVEMFVALLALALVAGFWVNHDVTCNEFSNPCNMSQRINGTLTATASTQYTFLTISIHVTGMDSIGTILCNMTNVTSLGGGVTSASQFFVTWGVFTLFYGVIALAVYIFTTANLELEWLVNYLVLTDLVFHIVWMLCWFIAAVEWAVVQSILAGFMNNLVTSELTTYCNVTEEPRNSGYLQGSIGDVFGFAVMVLFAANIYWVVQDTSYYIQWRASRSGGGSGGSGGGGGGGGYEKL